MADNSGEQNPPSDKEKTAEAAGSQTDTMTRAARQSVAAGLVSSVKHLQDAHAEAGAIKLRKSDKATWVLLVIAGILLIAALFLQNQKTLVTIIGDVLVAVVLFAFMAMRFGVVRSLSARQAVLTWQLIVGSFILGLYCAFNSLLIAMIYSGTMFH